MNPLLSGIAGIEAWPIDFRTPLLGLGLVFGLLVVATLMWTALGSLHRRWTGHHVSCPRDGGRAHVFVERNADGSPLRIASCSKTPGHVTCTGDCLAQVARA